MSKADNPNTKRVNEIRVEASQLRPGMHVRLPLPWLEHEFMFNSFIIADEEQAKRIAAMNLPHLYCDVKRSKVQPLPIPETPEELALSPVAIEEDEKAHLAQLKAQQLEEKIERAKAMATIRRRLDKAQHHYVNAARSVSSALKSFPASPQESISEVYDISENSASALLADPDSAIVLITEKGHNDSHAAHALSVMTLSLLLGKQAGLPEEALRTIGVGALLHDVGQLTFHASILRSTKRNKFEEEVFRSHCRQGYDSAARAGTLTPVILDVILHHHERMDGSGYPDRMSGEDISIASRMVGITNRFDNLTNPVDPLAAVSPSEALSTMWTKEKQFYDSTLLQLFIRAMGVYPPGSIVRLSNGRIGAVVASAAVETPLSPQVMVYDADVPRSQAIIIDLTKETDIKIEKPLRLSDRTDEELDYLLPRRRMSWSFLEGQH